MEQASERVAEFQRIADDLNISIYDIPWIIANPAHPLHGRVIFALAHRGASS